MSDSRGEAGDAVVVPAVASGSSITSIRSLGRRGVGTVAVSAGGGEQAVRSEYCDESRDAPSPFDDLRGYRDALLSVAERDDVATVVPLQEADIYVLSKHRAAFDDRVGTAWPAFERVRGVQDWLRLREDAAEAGIPTPETGLLDEWDDWDRPVVVKSRYSIREEENELTVPGMRVVEPGTAPDRQAIVDEMGHVPIAQEYVPGRAEHGFFALCEDGDPITTFQHRRVRSYSYTGGASVYRKSVDIPALARRGTELLSSLDWHGPAMVEFKFDPRDGRFKLMEVNPRFWGSLALPLHAGVDFPYRYYRLAAGRPIRRDPAHATGVGCHLVRGEVSYLHSVVRSDGEYESPPSLSRTVPEMLASFASHPNFDYLSLEDPMPFVADILTAAGVESPPTLPERG
ncbi:ATP-grasp domain-containing protein [Halosimplex marinum]|uniref:carboxylate--amine ligase n=1 Tax=Halosimplex marinum TaxID=3396620 RepID=UPI003F552697